MRCRHRWRFHRRLLVEMPEARWTYRSYVNERCERCGEVGPWKDGFGPADAHRHTDVMAVPDE